jgi:hypothetical protein
LMDVGPVNTMEATRVIPAHVYRPMPQVEPPYTSEESADQPEEVYYPSYGVAYVPYYARKRPDRQHPAQLPAQLPGQLPAQLPAQPPARHRGPQPRNY